MVEITIKGKAALLSALRNRKALSKANAYNAIEKQLGKEAQLTAAHVVKTKLSGDPLRRRTGVLAKSVVGVSGRGPDRTPEMRVGVFKGPALAYAKIHELGGVIVPRKAKALAIPIPGGRALTKAGVHRYTSPREYPHPLVFISARNPKVGHLGTLWDKRDLRKDGTGRIRKGQQQRPVYRLAKRVTVKGKDYLLDGGTEYIPRVTKRLGKFIVDLIVTGGQR